MPATFTIPLITVIPGQTITASLWNGEFENIDTNFVPAGMDDYSANDTQMQTATDPYPAGSTSRPTSLQGELERLRYVIAQLSGETYWYVDPDVDIATFKTRFDAHTHDGTSNQGPQIAAAGLASNAVTTAKILDANVTNAKLAADAVATVNIVDTAVTTPKIENLNVTTAKIANNAVDENKIATSVAGNGLAGGGGSALSVNVDGSTLEISSDSLRVKDAGITQAKLATAVVNQLGQNIGLVQVSSSSNATLVNYSGQGRLKLMGSASGLVNGTVTIDGTAFSYSLNTGEYASYLPGSNSFGDSGSEPNSIDIFFRTSLVITKSGGAGTVVILYERAA